MVVDAVAVGDAAPLRVRMNDRVLDPVAAPHRLEQQFSPEKWTFLH